MTLTAKDPLFSVPSHPSRNLSSRFGSLSGVIHVSDLEPSQESVLTGHVDSLKRHDNSMMTK